MQSLEQIAAAVLDTHAWVWMSAGAPEARRQIAQRSAQLLAQRGARTESEAVLKAAESTGN